MTSGSLKSILPIFLSFNKSFDFSINIKAIDEAVNFSKSRLKIRFKHSDEQEVIVSRERASAFKEWLE